MSGTGQSTPAELHLGDSLAAFVDGELRDDARERVLSHLASCPLCKSAADEQRRLKNVISAAAPPTLSAGLLARLQGLPAGGDRGGTDGTRDADGGGPFDGGVLDASVFGGRGDFSFLSPGPDLVVPADARSRGFRIHEVRRPSAGRRLAFAAAGAVSTAALALGGALPIEAAVDPGSRADDAGTAISPMGGMADSRTEYASRGRPDSAFRSSDEGPELFRAPTSEMSTLSPLTLTRALLPTAAASVSGSTRAPAPSAAPGSPPPSPPASSPSATPTVSARLALPLDAAVSASPLPLLGSGTAALPSTGD